MDGRGFDPAAPPPSPHRRRAGTPPGGVLLGRARHFPAGRWWLPSRFSPPGPRLAPPRRKDGLATSRAWRRRRGGGGGGGGAAGTGAPGGGGAGMDSRLDQETARWLKWDKNPLTLESVKQLIAAGNTEELQKCFCARMEFGTAGLRAAMGAGISHMNDLTIIQTTQVPHFYTS
ncbi:myosin-K heavy chain-like [Cervus canadensis]|uniref:myosin-K heavy chain-like n=1 Tax=Cervus canadensis TaxID=1574408 RepID=UPI001C9E4182|nr:myosin-K heavy chain-like [Cervus canadensis]